MILCVCGMCWPAFKRGATRGGREGDEVTVGAGFRCRRYTPAETITSSVLTHFFRIGFD